MSDRHRASRRPDTPKRVIIHPELHRHFALLSLTEGGTIQEHVHEALCQAAERPDLLRREPAVTSAG
jgi:hypothetical protein